MSDLPHERFPYSRLEFVGSLPEPTDAQMEGWRQTFTLAAKIDAAICEEPEPIQGYMVLAALALVAAHATRCCFDPSDHEVLCQRQGVQVLQFLQALESDLLANTSPDGSA